MAYYQAEFQRALSDPSAYWLKSTCHPGTLRSITDSTGWNMLATAEDPSVLDDITQSLRSARAKVQP